MTAPAAPVKPRGILQPGKVALPLPPLKSAQPTRFTAFIYGYSGAGKSFMLRSLLENPNLFPALVLVCDAGHATYQDLIDDDHLTVIETPGIDQIDTMIEWLLKNPHPYKTVCIDNLTELHRSALQSAAKDRVARTSRGTSIVMEQADYGIARTQVLNLLSTAAMRMPKVNFVVTALAGDLADEVSGLTHVVPALAGKLGTEVPGFFDIVGYLYTKTPTAAERREAERKGTKAQSSRILVTSQTSTVLQARNRGGKLGTEVVDPTFPKIYSMFTERVKPSPKGVTK